MSTSSWCNRCRRMKSFSDLISGSISSLDGDSLSLVEVVVVVADDAGAD